MNWASGGFKDGQKPAKHSWLLTEWEALAVRKDEDRVKMWEVLRRPPLRFALALKSREEVLLHVTPVNEFLEIKKDSTIKFSHDNCVMSYTIYELEESIRNKQTVGKEAGVRTLLDFFSPPPEIGPRKHKAVADGEPEAHDNKTVVRKEE